jgi:acetylornithine deacetylase/succinyl-diaminopimelate desuccinylase-like protein
MQEMINKLTMQLSRLRDSILSDAIIFNQTAYEARGRQQELEFITHKLEELGVDDYEVDDTGNISVHLNASRDIIEKSLLLFVQLHRNKFSIADRFIELSSQKAYGAGIAESALASAVLLNLLHLLKKENVFLGMNILFLFSPPPELEGRFLALENFVEKNRHHIAAALEINGISLGEIGYRSVGEYTLDIRSKTPLMEWSDPIKQVDAVSAMDVLTELASRLKSIGWPGKSGVFINISNLTSNMKLHKIPNKAMMRLDIMAHDNRNLEFAKNVVDATVAKLSKELRTDIEVKDVVHIPSNTMMENHPFLQKVIEIQKANNVKTKLELINDEATILLSRGIPALSLGMTKGEVALEEEYIEIKPLVTGLKILLSVITVTDNCLTGQKGGEDE